MVTIVMPNEHGKTLIENRQVAMSKMHVQPEDLNLLDVGTCSLVTQTQQLPDSLELHTIPHSNNCWKHIITLDYLWWYTKKKRTALETKWGVFSRVVSQLHQRREGYKASSRPNSSQLHRQNTWSWTQTHPCVPTSSPSSQTHFHDPDPVSSSATPEPPTTHQASPPASRWT